MNLIELDIGADGIARLDLAEPGPAFPLVSKAWREELIGAVDRLVAAGPELRAVLMSCSERSGAGGTLDEILALSKSDGAALFEGVQAVKQALRRVETLNVPVVACLAKGAIDGHWEIALCAHYRIAPMDHDARFGLSQARRGLMPGAGGVARSARLLGFIGAATSLNDGILASASEAHGAGLINLLTDEGSIEKAARDWIAAHPNSAQPWDAPGFRWPGGALATPAVAQAVALAPARLRQKTRGLYPAPEAILKALVEGMQVDIDTALRIESRQWAALLCNPTTANLVRLATQRSELIEGVGRRDPGKRFSARRVAVVGAGMMGAGIAYANAQCGIACAVVDRSLELAGRAREFAEGVIKKRLARKTIGELEAQILLAHIAPTASIADLGEVDIAIEAVFEDAALKHEVLGELAGQVRGDGVIASNTSTLPITDLALGMARPEDFIGLHFFSPVEKMELVEIIVGARTSGATRQRALDYVVQLGKVPIVVNDSRGFFTSRTFGAFVMEGAAMLGEGIAPALIEHAALAAGMPTGPLALLDETSLALSIHVLREEQKALARRAGQRELHPGERVVVRMVEELGRRGRAMDGGFYEYPMGGAKSLWAGLREAFPPRADQPALPELVERLLYRPAIEAARCLEERVLMSVAEGNVGSVLGIGFPAWTGGALEFINSQGLAHFMERAASLEGKHGARYRAPQLIAQRLAAGARIQ